MNYYTDLVDAIERYGPNRQEICSMVLGLAPDEVNESVVIAPWWEPGSYPLNAERVAFLGQKANVHAWNLKVGERTITYFKTGIGAPLVADVVLALGLCSCKRLLFVESVGSLDTEISIGDIVIPEYSVCGDGVSRYLTGEQLAMSDTFGEKTLPDADLLQELKQSVARICTKHQVNFHIGHVFSIDTIFAQFAHLEEILGMGCNVIEMETAAAFRAAGIAGIPMAALFSVSDNTVTRKSLISGRSKQEMTYRREVRKTVFPQVWEELFGSR